MRRRWRRSLRNRRRAKKYEHSKKSHASRFLVNKESKTRLVGMELFSHRSRREVSSPSLVWSEWLIVRCDEMR